MKSSWLALFLFLAMFTFGCGGGDAVVPPDAPGEDTQITEPEEIEMEEGLSN